MLAKNKLKKFNIFIKMVNNLGLNHSLVAVWVRQLRDVNIQNDRMRFRKNLERIGEIAAYEISKSLDYEGQEIQTPLGSVEMEVLQTQPILATILRAGLPLHQGLLNYFDDADCAFIASYRRHHKDGSFEIAQEYITAPRIADRPLIIADPMLATGSSLVLAIQEILKLGKPAVIHLVCAIASTQGIELIQRKFPDIHIWTAAIDDELTGKGYIVPGLGDAGDLCFGGKAQH